MNLLSGNPVTLEVLAFTILVGILLFGAVVVLVLRTRSLPVCGNCGFSSVQRTYSSHRSLDTFARACFLYPHRCQRCLHRFYCFGSPRMHRHSGNKTMAAAAK
jgi:hypothetical protein